MNIKKMVFLLAIISQSLCMDDITSEAKSASLSGLYKELLMCVFQYLPPSDIYSSALVSKRWHAIAISRDVTTYAASEAAEVLLYYPSEMFDRFYNGLPQEYKVGKRTIMASFFKASRKFLQLEKTPWWASKVTQYAPTELVKLMDDDFNSFMFARTNKAEVFIKFLAADTGTAEDKEKVLNRYKRWCEERLQTLEGRNATIIERLCEGCKYWALLAFN